MELLKSNQGLGEVLEGVNIAAAPVLVSFFILSNTLLKTPFSNCIMTQSGNIPDHFGVKPPPSWGSYSSSYQHLVIPVSIVPVSFAAPPLSHSRRLRSCQTQTCRSSLIHDIVPQPVGLISPLFTGSCDCVSVWTRNHPNKLSTCIKYACDITHTALLGPRDCWGVKVVFLGW